MDLDLRLVPAGGIVCKQLPQQVVILELDSGEYFSLDQVGLLVWSLLDGQRSVAAVASQVCQEYAVSEEQARQDVCELLSELLLHKVVVPA